MSKNRSLAHFGIVLVGLALFGGLRPTTASAQTSGLGFAFGAPGKVTCCGESDSTLHLGGGGELLIGGAVGVGGEIGYLGPVGYFSEGLGVMSVNGSYHFLAPGRRLRPFATAGYSLFLRVDDSYVNLWNVGGGVDYWMKPRVGVRVELRDHIAQNNGLHFWSPRIGIVFRGK